jgi:hypothetical protein
VKNLCQRPIKINFEPNQYRIWDETSIKKFESLKTDIILFLSRQQNSNKEKKISFAEVLWNVMKFDSNLLENIKNEFIYKFLKVGVVINLYIGYRIVWYNQ